MDIEFGLQPNCSDLVSHLNIKTDIQLNNFIKKVIDRGFNLALELTMTNWRYIIIPIPEHYLDKIDLNVIKDSYCDSNLTKLTVLFPLFNYFKLKFSKIRYARICITEKLNSPVIIMKPEIPYVTLKWGDGYDTDDELVLDNGQHCDSHNFHIFTTIRKLLRKSWHVHGGGYPLFYKKWLSKQSEKNVKEK